MSEAACGDYFRPHARRNVAAAKAEDLSLEISYCLTRERLQERCLDRRDVKREMRRG